MISAGAPFASLSPAPVFSTQQLIDCDRGSNGCFGGGADEGFMFAAAQGIALAGSYAGEARRGAAHRGAAAAPPTVTRPPGNRRRGGQAVSEECLVALAAGCGSGQVPGASAQPLGSPGFVAPNSEAAFMSAVERQPVAVYYAVNVAVSGRAKGGGGGGVLCKRGEAAAAVRRAHSVTGWHYRPPVSRRLVGCAEWPLCSCWRGAGDPWLRAAASRRPGREVCVLLA